MKYSFKILKEKTVNETVIYENILEEYRQNKDIFREIKTKLIYPVRNAKGHFSGSSKIKVERNLNLQDEKRCIRNDKYVTEYERLF